MTKIPKRWIRIDRVIFKATSFVLCKLVAARKFKKNKHHYIATYYIIRLGFFWGVTTSTIVRSLSSSTPAIFVAFLGLATGVLSFMWIGAYFSERKWERDYDRAVFMNRKNPVIYKIHKMMLKDMFRDHTARRVRLLQQGILFSLMALFLFVVNPTPLSLFYLVVFPLEMPAAIYALFVFDLGEPPKRKRKSTKKLTDLARELWEKVKPKSIPLPTPA